MKRGLLVVISGPSGSGKTTVAAKLLALPGFARAVTATTRAPRAGETDGVDYLFFTREEFLARVARGEFLEHATVHGNLYGTPRRSVEEALARGGVCLLAIDVQGAAALRGRLSPALFVFLKAPGGEELERRLRSRGTEDEATVARRLETAREELRREAEFDVSVVNDDLDRTVAEVRERIGKRLASEESRT
ncbi:MAG: guanylate kinase [Planctomycetes bacterium]|nr:guanylate kinase [Planctomycetota bacterium]